MSISYVGATGAVTAGTTSVAVGYPAGIQAGDVLLLAVTGKYSAYNAVSGFTVLRELVGGTGGTGADTGNVRTTVWWRVVDGSESGTATVSKSTETGTVILGRMFAYRKTGTYAWSINAEAGQSATASTSWQAVGSNNQYLRNGDVVVCVTGANTDAASFASHAVSATGSTFGSASERQDSGTTNGHDVRFVVSEHPVTAGVSSTFVTYTATGSTGTPDGTTIIVRLSEGDGIEAEDGSYTLTGQDATLDHESPQGSNAWSPEAWYAGAWSGTVWHSDSGGSFSMPAAQGSYALTGQSASLLKGYALTAEHGSYTLSGQDAALRKGLQMAAAQGSYTLTGQAAGQVRHYQLTAEQGSVGLTGISAALFFMSDVGKAWADDAWYSGAWAGTVWADNTLAPGSYRISCATGYYEVRQTPSATAWFESAWAEGAWRDSAWAGGAGATNLIYGRTLAAEYGTYAYTGDDALRDILLQTVPGGTYALTGQDATLRIGKTMTAAAGTFAVSGQSANLLRGFRLSAVFGGYLTIGYEVEFVVGIGEFANPGYYTLTGQDAGLSVVRTMSADVGSYVLTGRDANLNYGDIIGAELGTYAVTGQAATLTYRKGILAETGYYTLGGQIGVVEQPDRPKGGGKSKRKKPKHQKLVVEIDGNDFVVETEEEAAALLENAKTIYEEQVVEVETKAAKKVVAKPLPMPRIRASGPKGPELDALIKEVAELRNEIRALHERAVVAQKQAIDDDEEAIALLL